MSKAKRIPVYVPEELKQQMQDVADQANLSLSTWAKLALIAKMNEVKQCPPDLTCTSRTNPTRQATA